VKIPTEEYLTYYSTPPYNTSREHYFRFRPFFEEVSKIPENVGVEIGVYEGFNSLGICRFCSPKKVYLVDPYKVYEEVIEGNLTAYTQDFWNEIYRWTQERLEGQPVEFIRKPSLEAVGEVPDELDYVYIDGDHKTQAVIDDIEAWYPKVKKGGLIGGHDAIEPEVRDALGAWLYTKPEYGGHYHYKWNDWWIVK
jgi:hypothetical protein